ncbi:uncharacterized protein LOC128227070 isoform X1 [Mya arenaria]|uniref:uncharacterized protein LOC128227070 isoform X1 n=1 Tax=Mya arenaria TaxID=6604 RepID=UPI0022E28311|nr:uncharacterized protein LOC128227070 isoform X1 [Mya arenaria]
MGNCFSRANVSPREQNKNSGKPGRSESDEPAGYVGRSINSVNIDPNAVSSLKGISPNEETRRTGSANRSSTPTSSSEIPVTIDEGKNEITTVPNKLLKNKKKKGKRPESEICQCRTQIADLHSTVQRLTEENQSLLNRLSAALGAKMSDNNPDITDLSDPNRPTKLAEMFSELYDNEWTEAYDVLTEKDTQEKQDACKNLLKIFVDIYVQCRQKADADLNELNTVLKLFQMPEPSTQLVKQMKDNRKKHYETAVKEFRKELRPTIKKQFETKEQRKCLKPFFEKCITICWLMAVQDPPVYVDKNIDKRGEILDTSIYRIYTISGKTIDYIVWPVLYLTEGGNILVKGVAQGQTEMVSENEHMTSAQTTVLTETQTDVTSTKL